MEFDLEYKLQLFREEQPELFDEDGKRYGTTPISNNTGERMLQLIDELECALAKAETEIGQSEKFICPCCKSDNTYKTEAYHCNRCAVTTEV